jgi:hypothetical protein
VSQPSTTISTSAPDIEDGTGNDEPTQQTAISGVVFVDLNKNGVRDPGEPVLGGVTVRIVRTNGSAEYTVTTDVNGRYERLVEPGDYRVAVTIQVDQRSSNVTGSVTALAGLPATLDLGAPPESAPTQLALSGSNSGSMLRFGAALLLVGAFLLELGGRRRRDFRRKPTALSV